MYTNFITAENARHYQTEQRTIAGRRSLARLLRRPPEPTPHRAPTYGGITAVPSLPQQRPAPAQHAHHHAA